MASGSPAISELARRREASWNKEDSNRAEIRALEYNLAAFKECGSGDKILK
jgi:hypothetical protein